MKIIPSQFRVTGREGPLLRRTNGTADVPPKSPRGFFTCETGDSGRVVCAHVMQACERAKALLGSVDAVVMPECSVAPDDFLALRRAMVERRISLIAGVGQSPQGAEGGKNYVCVDVPIGPQHAVQYFQSKHHRWRLDAGQIKNYGIGSRLDPSEAYWEDIDVGNRRMLFLALRRWLVTSALICEDLARNDPVGELIRSVAPHLVIALLMDGPQLANRWSSRYAAALADDPGCSVLSVTSLGMVGMSRVDWTSNPNSTVALWKDASDGKTHELKLAEGAGAMALSITVRDSSETTADDRTATECHPVLSAVHQIPVDTEFPDFVLPASEEIHWLSAHDAGVLARITEQDIDNLEPSGLTRLSEEAVLIAREIWRIKAKKPNEKAFRKLGRHPENYAGLPSGRHTETAKAILKWHEGNTR